METERRYRILVGLSGGVDSAVAALLLREWGHDVVGVMMSLAGGDDPLSGCGAPEEWLQSPPLPAVAAALTQGRLSILAVGTASITGAGTSAPAAAWPGRLEALLRERSLLYVASSRARDALVVTWSGKCSELLGKSTDSVSMRDNNG